MVTRVEVKGIPDFPAIFGTVISRKIGFPIISNQPMDINIHHYCEMIEIYIKLKVMFGNIFCFLFSKTCFWEYKEKTIFLYF